MIRRHLSAITRRDPSLTLRATLRYEAEIVKRFDNFRVKVLQAVMTAVPRESEAVDEVLSASENLDSLIITEIVKPMRKVNASYTKTFYISGIKRATTFLANVGVTAYVQPVPTYQDAIDVLVERNNLQLSGITDAMSKDIMDTITDGVAQGKGTEKIARDILDSVDDIGINRARVMARTESMYAFNTAQMEQYERYGVKEVSWFTAEDERVCDQCDSLDGQTFPIDGAPDCPAHPQCRCILEPVIKRV